MITLPSELKAIRGFPGYFFRESDKRVFSIKIGGVLKPLKHKTSPPLAWNRFQGFSGWELSKDGIRRNFSDEAITKLLIQEDHQVPYA
jgi:hypothetical protein